ncbi:DUF4355 domain-containing protein [Lentilactobacillus parabuchneri]|uniref:DUF4355 domain-containing protein n=1 Tax=Lentilactobacillus parabuchneri TaxID=152331 RepID=UPI002236A759|nr:DUF4355 domain-containing protein [Lentilactobacillus parabuchneri]MCW4398099.1 DUF4355 domain-containing protein [Lentilactobacillus parabuchneri]
MKTNLQFFADPNTEPKPNDPNQNPDGKNPESKNTETAGKTYTQDDIGKMMASKAKEVESNLRDQFQKELEQKEQEWLEKGEKRAGMNASEKAQADLEEQRQAIKEQQDRLQEKLDEANRKDALAATRTVLTDKHIPAEFAEFISDVKEDVRNNNLDKFVNLFNKAVQEAVENKVTGNQSPQNGGQQFNASMTREDFAQMSLEEQTNLYRQNPDLYNKLK